MAGGKRGDEFNSQVMHTVTPAIIQEMTPAIEERLDADEQAREDEERRRARERDQSIALELRLLGNTMKRIERTQVRILQDTSASHQTQVDMLKVLREIRDSTASSAQESPQLQSMALDVLRSIKESVEALTAVAMRLGTNGHLQET